MESGLSFLKNANILFGLILSRLKAIEEKAEVKAAYNDY